MTITKPRERLPHLPFFAFLALLVVLGGGVYVVQYNALAKIRGEARRIKEEVVKAKLDEADLKHVVFETTDLKKLQEVAARRGFFIEAKPKYVHIGVIPETKSVVFLP